MVWDVGLVSIEPIFGVLLTISYRGIASLDESPDGITLEFTRHFKIVRPAIDPDEQPQGSG